MKGEVKAYSDAVNAGLILGMDGKTYRFHSRDWQGRTAPFGRVEFETDAENARKITEVRPDNSN